MFAMKGPGVATEEDALPILSSINAELKKTPWTTQCKLHGSALNHWGQEVRDGEIFVVLSSCCSAMFEPVRNAVESASTAAGSPLERRWVAP